MGLGEAGDKPRTWPRSGVLVVGELIVSLGICGWSQYPGGFAAALSLRETQVRGRRGFRATESQHLGPPHPGEDSEEAVAVRSWFEGGRDFPPPSAQPLKKEKHKLPSEEVPGTVCRLCTEKELGRTSQPTERGDLEVLK